MIIEEKAYWVWLTLIQNLGSRRIINLLNKYKKPERIWNLTKEQLMYVDGIGENKEMCKLSFKVYKTT